MEQKSARLEADRKPWTEDIMKSRQTVVKRLKAHVNVKLTSVAKQAMTAFLHRLAGLKSPIRHH